MKKIIILYFVLFSISLNAQIFFNYKISKPYCVFNFMETVKGSSTTSSTLRDYINDKTKNDVEFKKLCKDYLKIKLTDGYKISGFPDDRLMYRSNYDLVSMNAVNASNFNDFKQRNVGIITFDDNQKLIAILKKAEIVYDKIIWNDNKIKIEKQLKALSKYKEINASIYEKFNNFYNSSWIKEVPFQVAIYPIPGKKGNTIATPHINSLCVSVLTDETDYSVRNGIVLHEMCHILYENQSAEFQNQLDKYFKNNTSSYSRLAYTYINEGLATALGNGWAYKKMNKKIDETDWYNNETINGFAKVLYPLIESYLQQNKSLDADFVDNAIELFSKKFPNSICNYEQSLNKTITYCDNFEEIEVVDHLGKYFNISGLSLSSPILHALSIETITDNSSNQFFIIDGNQNETIYKLSSYFPQLKDLKFENKPLNLSFIDSKKRVVIMLILNNKKELDLELEKMKVKKYFDLKQPLQ
jgi:predicted metal-dependent hydrolase